MSMGTQQAFAGFESHMGTTRYAVGWSGEKIVALAFQESGYLVRTDHDICDMSVIDSDGELFAIEVKTARRGNDGKWRFCLWKLNHQDHRKADVVVLLAVTKSGFPVPFVCPIEVLTHQNQAVITSYPTEYRGKLAIWRQTLRGLKLPEVCHD